MALTRGGGYGRDEYKCIREALAEVNASEASFLYCEPDNSMIWQRGGGSWTEDGAYAMFRQLADAKYGPEIGGRLLGYFKRYCVTSHVSIDEKKRLLEKAS